MRLIVGASIAVAIAVIGATVIALAGKGNHGQPPCTAARPLINYVQFQIKNGNDAAITHPSSGYGNRFRGIADGTFGNVRKASPPLHDALYALADGLDTPENTNLDQKMNTVLKLCAP